MPRSKQDHLLAPQHQQDLPWSPAHCLQCGYSLRGLAKPLCPECGTLCPPPYLKKPWNARTIACLTFLGLFSGLLSPFFFLDAPGIWFGLLIILPMLLRRQSTLADIFIALTASIFGYSFAARVSDPFNLLNSYNLGYAGLFISFPLTGALGMLPLSIVLFLRKKHLHRLLLTILAATFISIVFPIACYYFDNAGIMIAFCLWQALMALVLAILLNSPCIPCK